MLSDHRKRNERVKKGKRLTLAEVWEKSRRLGSPSKSESAQILRKLRDQRYGR